MKIVNNGKIIRIQMYKNSALTCGSRSGGWGKLLWKSKKTFYVSGKFSIFNSELNSNASF